MDVDVFADDIAPWHPGPCPRCGGPVGWGNYRATRNRPRILPAYQAILSRRTNWVYAYRRRPASRPIRIRPGRTVTTVVRGLTVYYWDDPNRCPDCRAQAIAAAHASAVGRTRVAAAAAATDGGQPDAPVRLDRKSLRASAADRKQARARKHRARQGKAKR